jgi:hypothetical protein
VLLRRLKTNHRRNKNEAQQPTVFGVQPCSSQVSGFIVPVFMYEMLLSIKIEIVPFAELRFNHWQY